MGRARRTERGEEGRKSRKRLERERERTERERREEKTEATIVGKTRKWPEWGVMNRALAGSPTAPLTAPTCPGLSVHLIATRLAWHYDRGRGKLEAAKDLQQVRSRQAEAGKLCPGQGSPKPLSSREVPHSPTRGLEVK